MSTIRPKPDIFAACMFLLAAGTLFAQPAPDNTLLVLSNASILNGGLGTFGAFTFDPDRNCFWLGIQGNNAQGIRRYDLASSTLTVMVDHFDMQRLAVASDGPGGATWAGDGGAQRPFGMLLNKTTHQITVPAPSGGNQTLSYPPGTILYSCDQPDRVFQGGSTFQSTWTKNMYRYDLRRVGDATSVQPDYANAQNGAGTVIGAAGVVDWNDLFSVVVNNQQFMTAAGVIGANIPTTGRQGTWSTDGLSIYWNASDMNFGGIWKIDAQSGALSYIYVSKGGTPSLLTELAVIHTNLRDLDANNPATGDQILFRGTGNASNPQGISYIIDEGATVSGPYVLLRKPDFNRWMEWNGRYYGRLQVGGLDPGVNSILAGSPDAWSMTAGPDGTLYYTDQNSSGGLWRYDPQNRLSCFRTTAQHVRWYRHEQPTSTSTATQVLRPQLRTVDFTGPGGTFSIPQFMFRDNFLDGIAGVNVFKPGDFNRDDVVDNADVALLDSAIAVPLATFTTGSGTSLRFYEAPTDGAGAELEPANVQAYLDYIKCDMNNNTLVTVKDRQILGRFVGKAICDFDWDDDVDLADFSHMQLCYTGTATLSTYKQMACDDADLTGDLKVDSADTAVFTGCATRSGVPADVDCGL